MQNLRYICNTHPEISAGKSSLYIAAASTAREIYPPKPKSRSIINSNNFFGALFLFVYFLYICKN